MKKTLLILLAFVILFSLCACNNGDRQTPTLSNPSQNTTEGTEKPSDGTEGTTGTTQAPTDETTTAPTDEPTTAPTDEPTTAPTDEPTTPPTQAPTETPTTPPTIQPTTCSHSWKDATCTAPKTCSKCGNTEGSAAGHSWNSATCITPKTCTTCGATEGSAVGHSWNSATCTTPKTCKSCGTTEGGAAGHSWNAATCTAPKTCKTCGATEGSAAGHSWNAATCTAPKTCSKCGNTEGSAAGHSWSAATCTAPKTCKTCGATGGSAAGHSWNNATCITPKTCKTCGTTEGSAAGHKWGEWKDNSSYWRNPCTEDGIERRTCKNCYAQEEQVIKAAHSYEEGYCTRCEARDANYAFVYIDFKDKLFEAYVKQALGFEPEDKVATVDMKKLTSFKIESRVSNVEELKYATNLKSITIEASNVSNLNVLSELPITYVHLGYNGGTTEIDVSFMKNLTEVTQVYFYDCILTGGSMEDVVSSPKLTYYHCSVNHTRYEVSHCIDYLAEAKNVTKLSLWNVFFDTDISVLLSLSNVKYVQIYNHGLQNKYLTEEHYAVIDQLVISGVVVDIV